MRKRSDELIRRTEPVNEDAYSVVERHPRRKSPLLAIFVLVICFLLFNFFSGNHIEDNIPVDIGPVIQTLQGATNIHQLVVGGKVDKVRDRVMSLDDEAINKVVNGMTPIMLAASAGNVEIIDLLFTNGADPNKRGSDQRTALQYATEKNHVEAAKRLLAYGADIDAYDNGKLTPLVMAANRGYTELALYYIDKGADVDIQHVQGWTALIDAVARNDVRLVKALLEAGADRDLLAGNGKTALDYAREYGFNNMINLLDQQANPVSD